VQVEVRTSSGDDAGVCPGVTSPGRLFDFPFALDAGMLQSGFLVGRLGATGNDRLSVLLCNDIATPGPLTPCQVFR
jgi:hypothetical protein